MSRKISEEVKKIYQRYPFPGEKLEAKIDKWRLAPMDWIHAVWNRESVPDRILVAGCGTGAEAFALRRKFPNAEIVAVDFSPRSISLAEQAQKRLRGKRNISFLVADLEDHRFERIAGSGFDFVACHGVLSYSSEPLRVLSNLANVTAHEGALYLGVNGSDHFSVCFRQVLSLFGIDPAELKDVSATRKVLELCDAIQGSTGKRRAVRIPESLLAGDLFGPLIHNLPLSDWIEMAKKAGLYFRSSFTAYAKFRRILESEVFLQLWPKTHAEAIQIVDLLSPAPFHKLLFTRMQLAEPPWNQRDVFGFWKPSFTSLFKLTLPGSAGLQQSLQKVTLKSAAVGTQIDLMLSGAEISVLRECNGKRTMDEIMRRFSVSVTQSIIQRLLYGLYQLLVLRFDP